MSNNRFLQSKEPHKSNRFNFLDSEEPNKKLHIKDKDKKNNHQYDSFNNSFTKPSSKDKYTNNNRHNERKNDRNQREYPPKNSNNQFREETIAPTTEFTVSDELFPSLNPIIVPSNNISTNFKDALNHETEIGVTEDITLRSGWIQISKVDNKTVINQANIGPYDIKMQQIQELQEDPNYIMNRIINVMQKKWIKYKIDYNNIYGEGAYDDLHYLSPVYDSEYDSDENNSVSDFNELDHHY